MKRISLFAAFALCSALIFSLSFAQAQRAPRVTRPVRPPATPNSQSAISNLQSNTLPLKRVILYSNGVAYFERRGQVTGKAEINLAFKQSQVDDVLKSLVVLDLGKGRVGAVSYISSAPPDARLKEIPFSIGAASDPTTGGLAAVLRQDAKQLVARYIAKADQQETCLEQIAKEKKAAQEELNRWQAKLNAAIKNPTLERKL